MKITVSVRNFDATEKLKKFANDELDQLTRFYDGQMSGEMVLDEKNNLKTVEVRVAMLGKMLPAQVEGSDFYKIIPQAVKKIEKQIRSTKSKLYSR